MSICDRCIHDEVCGLEANHEEAITFCADMKPKDILDKIRAEIIEEKDFAYADFERYKVEYLGVDAEYVEDELPHDDFRYGMERAIDLIDKYRKWG